MGFVRSLFLALLALTIWVGGPAARAMADDHECPSHPEATYTLSGDPDSDATQIARLAALAKQKGAVCIMAFYDALTSNSKMLAFRRANWTMERFTDNGVSSGTITRVLRAGDKSTARIVQIVLGP